MTEGGTGMTDWPFVPRSQGFDTACFAGMMEGRGKMTQTGAKGPGDDGLGDIATRLYCSESQSDQRRLLAFGFGWGRTKSSVALGSILRVRTRRESRCHCTG